MKYLICVVALLCLAHAVHGFPPKAKFDVFPKGVTFKGKSKGMSKQHHALPFSVFLGLMTQKNKHRRLSNATINSMMKNNICLNPNDFDPSAINGLCAYVASTCASYAWKGYGGLVHVGLPGLISSLVPQCCNGNTGYNQNSECGAGIGYCNGGDFDYGKVLQTKCEIYSEGVLLPNDEIGSCDTENCRSSETACHAARGKAVPHMPGKTYSGLLEFKVWTCDRIYQEGCIVGYSLVPCMYKEEGSGMMLPCQDAECHKSREACMSRAGEPMESFIDSRSYPAQMDYNPSRTGDPQSIQRAIAEMNLYSSKCCKTGSYTNACFPSAQTGTCVKSGCCGKGTAWQEGSGCVPTRSGVIDACKATRGKWAWTCDADGFCPY